MAAIVDLRHTQTSNSIHFILSVLPEPENFAGVMEFRCYHDYKLRCTLFSIYFRFRAAI